MANRADLGQQITDSHHGTPQISQHKILRFLGTFLADPELAPAVVIGYVADQLGLDPADLKGYGDHQAQIRDLYGYTAFGTIQWLELAR